MNASKIVCETQRLYVLHKPLRVLEGERGAAKRSTAEVRLARVASLGAGGLDSSLSP